MARKSKKQIALLLVDLVKVILRLNDWTIKIQFVKLPGGSADCEATPEYKEAVIRFDLRRISTDDLISFVVHEMLHCVIWRLAHVAESFTDDDAKLEWSRIEEEYLTTQLEQIIVPLVTEQLKEAIKKAK